MDEEMFEKANDEIKELKSKIESLEEENKTLRDSIDNGIHNIRKELDEMGSNL